MSSRRVALVGWELGAGRGHVEPLVPIVDALLRHGWVVVAAMRDIATARSAFARLDRAVANSLEVRQAPIFLHYATPPPKPLHSLAEILAHAGFANSKLWQPVVAAWSRLIDHTQPNVVIADCAPSLTLAARGQVEVIVTGNGWTMPPDLDVVPPLPVKGYDRAVAVAAEHAILASATAIRPRADIRRFVDLLRGASNFVFTHALLDPYRTTRKEQTWWPANIARSPSLSEEAGGIIAYLSQMHPAQKNLAEAIASGPSPGTAYFGGSQVMGVGHLAISPSPLDLGRVLPNARCVVHHGGLGMTSWCLALGLPQVLMPTDLEKYLNAVAAVATGRAVMLAPTVQAQTIAVAIDHAVELGIEPPSMGNAQSTINTVLAACNAAGP